MAESVAANQNDARSKLARTLAASFAARDHIRKGLCCLNASQFDAAIPCFQRAESSAPDMEFVEGMIALASTGASNHQRAAVDFARSAKHPDAVADLIREAYARWHTGNRARAISILRSQLKAHSESPSLHFHLATMLGAIDEHETAELHYTQALALDRDHVDALMGLAMICGARHAPHEALRHLKRALRLRPWSARIGLMLAMAAKAADHAGYHAALFIPVPDESSMDDRLVVALAHMIHLDPELLDALLEGNERDSRTLEHLALAAAVNIERRPDDARTHFASARILTVQGRINAAIKACEKGIEFDPASVEGFIQLGKLGIEACRYTEAIEHLERAVALGAEYADVYFHLGNLYRDRGDVPRARNAYKKALTINDRFEAAREALKALAA